MLSPGYRGVGIAIPGARRLPERRPGGPDQPGSGPPGAALERQLTRPAGGTEVPQLPVRLPAPEELRPPRAQQGDGQFAPWRWLGPAGRPLAQAGMIRPADARELITLLGTGDEGLRFRSAAELPGLDLIVTWAKKARLAGGRGPG